jgi:hypothetical protein
MAVMPISFELELEIIKRLQLRGLNLFQSQKLTNCLRYEGRAGGIMLDVINDIRDGRDPNAAF